MSREYSEEEIKEAFADCDAWISMWDDEKEIPYFDGHDINIDGSISLLQLKILVQIAEAPPR